MTNDELVKEIKSQAYWRTEIHSTEYQANRLPTRAAMEDILSKATVSLRGWPYPYYGIRAEDLAYNGKWLEGKINWEQYKEYWRLYESGQWIHYSKVRTAGMPVEEIFRGRLPRPLPHAGYIPIRGEILFTLTEVLHFAVGLAQRGLLEPEAFLSIELHNTKDYMLFESFEWFFRDGYVNPSDTPITFKHILPPVELPARADKMAMDMAIKVYSIFNWIPAEAAIRNLVEDQKKLIERRL
jgi:hypothetical protein